MKQKVDRKPEEKDGCLAKLFQKICTFDGFVDCLVWLLLIGTPLFFFIALAMTACEQAKIQKAVQAVPTEQRQPMIEIPVERTVCVKPAEGFCMEYRTNRIRTP